MENNPSDTGKERYRLIFERMVQGAERLPLATAFRKELGLSPRKVDTLLKDPPRILLESNSRHEVEYLQRELERMGGLTTLTRLVTVPALPFRLCRPHERQIKGELSKTLRCRAHLALILVQADPGHPEVQLPSMMGPFGQVVADETKAA